MGDLPVKQIPVQVCVGGTPLIMQPGRLLLPGYSPQKPQGTLRQPQGWPALPQGSATLLKGASQQPLGSSLQSRSQLPGTQTEPDLSPAVLQQESKAEMAMDFGQLLADTKMERAFHVFNTSSMAVQLDWTFYR